MYYIVLLQYLFLYIYVILLFICVVQPKALYFADLLINLLCFALLIIKPKNNFKNLKILVKLHLTKLQFLRKNHKYWRT